MKNSMGIIIIMVLCGIVTKAHEFGIHRFHVAEGRSMMSNSMTGDSHQCQLMCCNKPINPNAICVNGSWEIHNATTTTGVFTVDSKTFATADVTISTNSIIQVSPWASMNVTGTLVVAKGGEIGLETTMDATTALYVFGHCQIDGRLHISAVAEMPMVMRCMGSCLEVSGQLVVNNETLITLSAFQELGSFYIHGNGNVQVGGNLTIVLNADPFTMENTTTVGVVNTSSLTGSFQTINVIQNYTSKDCRRPISHPNYIGNSLTVLLTRDTSPCDSNRKLIIGLSAGLTGGFLLIATIGIIIGYISWKKGGCYRKAKILRTKADYAQPLA